VNEAQSKLNAKQKGSKKDVNIEDKEFNTSIKDPKNMPAFKSLIEKDAYFTMSNVILFNAVRWIYSMNLL
jgi:hypothetical protein